MESNLWLLDDAFMTYDNMYSDIKLHNIISSQDKNKNLNEPDICTFLIKKITQV